MTFVIGLLAFALTTLWLEQDITESLRSKVHTWLTRRGWSEVVNARNQPIALSPRKGRGIYRFAWELLTCPYCLSVWIAGAATWYVLGNDFWTKAWWTLWWSAVGVAWVVIAVFKMAQSVIEELGARDEERARANDG